MWFNPAKEGEGMVATQKFVRLGERRGDYIEVLDGLDAADRIVTDGAFKLYPGAPVILQDDRAPVPQLAPTPADA
jgi:membrane fusion protein (multidrug efflux system)